MLSRANRVACVTGGGRRLGKHIALALGKEGYDVIVNYHSSARGAQETVNSLRAMGRKSIAVKADVSNKRAVTKMIRRAVKLFGNIDILVNNAAIFLDSPLLKTDERTWDRTMEINLKGVFLCSQAVAPYMLKRGSGKIINIASLGGIQAWKQHLPYSVSKAGVIMLTRILAKTLAPRIQVNAIAPGTIFMEGEETGGYKHVPKRKIPLKRYGKPSDITSMVTYLASSADYITGQVFTIDGGRTI
jgi:NAD(P)-dependent dehydrogenase (short-subunit alcohol dehydrogenase family)